MVMADALTITNMKIVPVGFKRRSDGKIMYTGTIDADSNVGVSYPLTASGRITLQSDVKDGDFDITVDNGAKIPKGTKPTLTKPAAPALSVPTGLTATVASSTQINLAWTAVAGATGYVLERSGNGSTGWTQIATPSATSFQDTGLTASTIYYYRLRATNSENTSGNSSTVSATTSAGSTAYSQTQNGPVNRFIYTEASGTTPTSTDLPFTGFPAAASDYDFTLEIQTNENSGSGQGALMIGDTVLKNFTVEAAAGGNRTLTSVALGKLTLPAGNATIKCVLVSGSVPYNVHFLTITRPAGA